MKKLFAKILILMLIIVMGVMLASCDVLDILMDTSGIESYYPTEGNGGDVSVDTDADFNKGFFETLDSFNSSIIGESVRVPSNSLLNSEFSSGIELEITDYIENEAPVSERTTIVKDNVIYILNGDDLKIVKLYSEGSAIVTSNPSPILNSEISANHSIGEIFDYVLVDKEQVSDGKNGIFELDPSYVNNLFALINTYVDNKMLLNAGNAAFVLDATEYKLKDALSIYSSASSYKITLDKASYINGTGTLYVSVLKNKDTVAKINLTTKSWKPTELSIKINSDNKTISVLRQEGLYKKEIIKNDNSVEYSLIYSLNGDTMGFSFESCEGSKYYSGLKVTSLATLNEKQDESDFDSYTIVTEITKGGETRATSATLVKKSDDMPKLTDEQASCIALADGFYNSFKSVNSEILSFANNGYKQLNSKIDAVSKKEIPLSYYYIDEEAQVAYFVDYILKDAKLFYSVRPAFDYEGETYLRSTADLSFNNVQNSQLMIDAAEIYDKASSVIAGELDGYTYKKQSQIFVYDYIESEGIYIIVDMIFPQRIDYTDDISTYTVSSGYVHSVSDEAIHSFEVSGKNDKCCVEMTCAGCQTTIVAQTATHTYTNEILRETDNAVLNTCSTCKYTQISIGDNCTVVIEPISNKTATTLGITETDGKYSVTKVFFDNVSDDMVLEIPQLKTGKIVAITKARAMPSNEGGRFASVIIPEGVEVIESNAFRNEKIANLTLPATLKYIQSAAFCDSEIENDPEFSNALLKIEVDAFRNCLFTKVIIPENVTNLGNAFDKNPRLTTLIINAKELKMFGGIKGCDNLVTVEFNGKVYSMAGIVSPHITEITFPEGVTAISSFAKNPYLVSITVPEGVKIIDSYAFEGCTALEKVVLPETVTKIGKNAFLGCVSLNEINIPKGLLQIDGYVFEGCDSLKEITVYKDIVLADGNAFSKCSLERIYFKGTSNEWDEIGFYPSSTIEIIFE